MENTFFMPIGKRVILDLIDNKEVYGTFGGFVQFGGIPAVYLYNDIEGIQYDTLIPINQVITFKSEKPKQIIL